MKPKARGRRTSFTIFTSRRIEMYCTLRKLSKCSISTFEETGSDERTHPDKNKGGEERETHNSYKNLYSGKPHTAAGGSLWFRSPRIPVGCCVAAEPDVELNSVVAAFIDDLERMILTWPANEAQVLSKLSSSIQMTMSNSTQTTMSCSYIDDDKWCIADSSTVWGQRAGFIWHFISIS